MMYQEREEGEVRAWWWKEEEQTLNFQNEKSIEEAPMGTIKLAI